MNDKMKAIAEKILSEIEELLMDEDVKEYDRRAPKYMEVKTNDPQVQEKVVDKLEEALPEENLEAPEVESEEEEQEELFPGKKRKIKR